MKTFGRPRTLVEVRKQCAEQGVKLVDRLYKQGSDHISIFHPQGRLLWSPHNGKFFGTTPLGVEFSSDSSAHDNDPWMQELLDFFYMPKETP